MNICIRNEEAKDHKIVENLAREAFWNLYIPGCTEHYILHKMRNHHDFIKELSFVIELDNEIVGAIFYTNSKIVSKDNIEYEMITFGPFFISPLYHRKGLGRKLITHSINVAKNMGYRAIITLGYPYHYETYGFLSGKKYNISMADGKFYKGLLVLPLYDGALNNISGYANFFDIPYDENEFSEFDKTFIEKPKMYQKSQDEYLEMSTMIDE